jgi:DNA end-binding protein Ku
MTGDLYSLKRSGADKEEAFKLACPSSTPDAAHGVKQQYSCDEHGTIGSAGECGKMREVSKGHYILVDADEVAAAKASDAEKGVIALTPYAIEDIEAATVVFGNSYTFVPAAKNQLCDTLLAILADDTNGFALVAEANLGRGSAKFVRAVNRDGELVIQELLRPEDVSAVKADHTQVEAKVIEMAKKLLGQLTEPFDPDTYASKARQRIAELVAAKTGGTAPASTSSAPKRTPEQDFEALLAASVEAVS